MRNCESSVDCSSLLYSFDCMSELSAGALRGRKLLLNHVKNLVSFVF